MSEMFQLSSVLSVYPTKLKMKQSYIITLLQTPSQVNPILRIRCDERDGVPAWCFIRNRLSREVAKAQHSIIVSLLIAHCRLG